jgi:hypothetical protein
MGDRVIVRNVKAVFSLGEVVTFTDDVMTPSLTDGSVSYTIEGLDGEIQICGPLAPQIAKQIVERMNAPSPPPQADREAVREAVKAMRDAMAWIKGAMLDGYVGDRTVAKLAAAITKLGENP